MTKRLATIITLMALFVGALAQGELVSQIEVTGEKNIAESTILAAMRTKTGQIYDAQGRLTTLEEHSSSSVDTSRARTCERRIISAVRAAATPTHARSGPRAE